MNLKICKLHPDAATPIYATAGAACFDIQAIEPAEIESYRAHTIRTGLAFEVPEGQVMLVFSRSGHGFKHGVRLSNCVGVIDADYRGEVMVSLRNDQASHFDVRQGDRIAQALLLPVERVSFEVVEQMSLSLTERGEGGFGSTG